MADTVVFEDLMGLVLGIHELRLRVEAKMYELPEDYNRIFQETTLRLRSWPRKKGQRPYAVYWITFFPKKVYYEDWLQEVIDDLKTKSQGAKPAWYHRLKIRTSRDMDRAIHRGGLDHQRREVHSFHRKARSLNEAHKILTGTLDVIRKMLESRAGGKFPGFEVSPPPADLLAEGLPMDVQRVLDLLWRLESLIDRRQCECRDLTNLARHKPLWQPFRLTFPDDHEHPYGRFLWVNDETGVSYGSLGYRTRKDLHLPSRVSRFISPFEAERRLRDRELKKSTALARRIKLMVPAALRRARACLGEAWSSPSLLFLDERRGYGS